MSKLSAIKTSKAQQSYDELTAKKQELLARICKIDEKLNKNQHNIDLYRKRLIENVGSATTSDVFSEKDIVMLSNEIECFSETYGEYSDSGTHYATLKYRIGNITIRGMRSWECRTGEEADTDVSYSDGTSEYGKSVDMADCKGTVCRPHWLIPAIIFCSDVDYLIV
jgi:hypothetical protein